MYFEKHKRTDVLRSFYNKWQRNMEYLKMNSIICFKYDAISANIWRYVPLIYLRNLLDYHFATILSINLLIHTVNMKKIRRILYRFVIVTRVQWKGKRIVIRDETFRKITGKAEDILHSWQLARHFCSSPNVEYHFLL